MRIFSNTNTPIFGIRIQFQFSRNSSFLSLKSILEHRGGYLDAKKLKNKIFENEYEY